MKCLRDILLLHIGVFCLLPCFAQNKKEKIPTSAYNQQLIEDGKYCIETEDYNCALFIFNQLVSAEPDNVFFLYNRATCYSGLHKFTRAIEDLEHAIRLSDSCTECYYSLAKFYRYVSKPEESVLTLKNLIAKDSFAVEAYIYLGLVYIDESSFDSALIMFNRGLDVDDSNPLLLFSRAALFYEMFEYKKGDGDIYNVLQQDKSFIHYLLKEVKRYVSENNLDIAERILNIAIHLYPQEPELYNRLAVVCEYRRKTGKAIENYSKAITLTSDSVNTELFYERGKLLFKQHDYEKAISDFSFFLSKKPDRAEVLLKRGYSYYKIEKDTLAVKDWKRALELGNNKAKMYLDTYIIE